MSHQHIHHGVPSGENAEIFFKHIPSEIKLLNPMCVHYREISRNLMSLKSRHPPSGIATARTYRVTQTNHIKTNLARLEIEFRLN